LIPVDRDLRLMIELSLGELGRNLRLTEMYFIDIMQWQYGAATEPKVHVDKRICPRRRIVRASV
jgi:hypothetical protein